MAQKPPFQPPTRPDELDNTKPIPRPHDPADSLVVALQAVREKRASAPPPQDPQIMGAPSDETFIETVIGFARDHRNKLLWGAVVLAGIIVFAQFLSKKTESPNPNPATGATRPMERGNERPASPNVQQPATSRSVPTNRPPVANPLKATSNPGMTNPFSNPLFQPRNSMPSRSLQDRNIENERLRERELEREREKDRERDRERELERERADQERDSNGHHNGDAQGQSGEPASPQSQPDGMSAPPPPPTGN